jgi:chloride channel 3/4/5
VLLVTKAVGDFLGTNGIADEMIRFNGYPFLEKEDHAFNVSVSNVMKKGLHTLPASGMRVRDLEEQLASTQVKGFPIVLSNSSRTLQGYIGRTELCYVLGKPLPYPW